jgi:DNA-directed RNA polymerase subunit E'/Rpb7
MEKQTYQQKKRREQKIVPIYSRSLITKSILVSINNVGKNINQTIETIISSEYEGKCSVEGYIKPNSCKVITISAGKIERGNLISYLVVFECQVCFPVEGTLIQCVAKNITKAGIRAVSSEENPSPVNVFLAKEHHLSVDISDIKEGTIFTAKVIGQRFELNDRQVSVIAEYVKPKIDYGNQGQNKKSKIKIY